MSAILLPTITAGGSAAVITTTVGTVVTRILKRVAADVVRDAIQAVAEDVTDLKVQFAAEHGGNSGGLRQAVNTLDAKVDGVIVDVAHLKGVAVGQASAAKAGAA